MAEASALAQQTQLLVLCPSVLRLLSWGDPIWGSVALCPQGQSIKRGSPGYGSLHVSVSCHSALVTQAQT